MRIFYVAGFFAVLLLACFLIIMFARGRGMSGKSKK